MNLQLLKPLARWPTHKHYFVKFSKIDLTCIRKDVTAILTYKRTFTLQDSVSGDPVAASASAATGLLANPVVVGGLASPIVRLENRHFPNFYVENLQSGTAFGMVVYAQNSKVREESRGV